MPKNAQPMKKTQKSAKPVTISSSADSSDISDVDENESLVDAFKEYDNKNKSNKSKSTNSTLISDTSNISGASNTSNKDNKSNRDEIDEEARDEYIKTTVTDNVIKYLKIDSMMKKKQEEHREEMKPIKEAKDKLEKFLIDYLDKIDEEYFQIGDKGTLVKTEIESKAAIKIDDITSGLLDGFKKYELYEDEAEAKKVIEDLVKTIDAKRAIKTRKVLKKVENKPAGKSNTCRNRKTNKSDSASKASESAMSNASCVSSVSSKVKI